MSKDWIKWVFVKCFLLVLIFNACTRKQVWLDEMRFKEIINTYSAPKRNTSFPGMPLNISGKIFKRGLGLHAPAELNIDLKGQAVGFDAYVGIDTAKFFYHSEAALDSTIRKERFVFPADYVYDNKVDHSDFTIGGTAIVKILADGEEVFNSGLLTASDSARKIQLSLSGVETLTLIAEPTEDGSFTDFVDLADAFITYKQKPDHTYIYCHPKDIMVNHTGFHPAAPKKCYIHGKQDTVFTVVDARTGKSVYTGEMIYQPGNIGEYLVGDFSSFTDTGRFLIQCKSRKSVAFNINKDVIKHCLRKQLQYVAQQRCGHPAVGWNPHQHLDDGKREDNGKHQDVTGGWYDACDVRKPVGSNAALLFALAKMARSETDVVPEQMLIEEIKWGNKFLFAMQEPEGYLMSSLGFGDYKKSDNRWTDNIPDNKDDRYIQTRPDRYDGQLYFIVTELLLAEYFESIEPAYAVKCEKAAINCYDWVFENDSLCRIKEYALATMANCYLFMQTGNNKYKESANIWLDVLLQNKKTDTVTPITIFGNEHRGVWNNFYVEHVLDALYTYCKIFPDAPMAVECQQVMKDYCNDFFIQLQEKNAFHLMPWFAMKDPEYSNKTIGNYHYRNFLHVGLNRSIALKAYDMLQCLVLLDQGQLIERAQQQLDWIYGANPFNASYVTGLGYHQPSLFEAGNDAFEPLHTPAIKGGVMTGICADDNDNPALYPGWWWATEYWAPTVAAVVLLENELDKYYR